MTKGIVLEKDRSITYREFLPEEYYKPTAEEEAFHGCNFVTRYYGDPGEGEIEVQALCGAFCTHEVSVYKGDLTYPSYPRIMGHEAVHVVKRVGKGVTHVKEGDFVSCCWYHGQWANNIIGPAKTAYLLPEKLDDPANWIIEPAASIVNAVSMMTILPGERVLLIGAGFMGLMMIQLMSGYPMAEFTVADMKQENLDLAKKFGAYETVNIAEDAGKETMARYNPGHFDVVIDCTGSQGGLDEAVRLCGDAGKIYLFGWHRTQRTIDFKVGHLRGQTIMHTSPGADTGRAYERHWATTIELFKRGKIDLHPLITHRYRTDEVKRAMDESCVRGDGFIKSVIYLD